MVSVVILNLVEGKENMTNNIEFKISYNAMMNMIDEYARSKSFCLDRETECKTDEDFDDLNDNPNYLYYYGRAEMAEHWLILCGVSPASNIVQEKINSYLQYMFN